MNEEELTLCPSDVMIGDWVYDTENECYTQITIKDFRNDGNNIFFYKPILLTKKVLEKIGGVFNEWTEMNDDWIGGSLGEVRKFYQIGSFLSEVDDSIDEGVVLVSSIYGNTAYILYFHELQNALKLCGINKKFELE